MKVLLGFLGFQNQPLKFSKMRAVPKRHAEQLTSGGGRTILIEVTCRPGWGSDDEALGETRPQACPCTQSPPSVGASNINLLMLQGSPYLFLTHLSSS